MPLDCHLFCDIQEANAKNISLSFILQEPNDQTYSASTPKRLYEALKRTINNGVPTSERIIQDIMRIHDETLDRIIASKGCFIEDESRATRKGQRKQTQQAVKSDKKLKLTVLDGNLVDAVKQLA